MLHSLMVLEQHSHIVPRDIPSSVPYHLLGLVRLVGPWPSESRQVPDVIVMYGEEETFWQNDVVCEQEEFLDVR